MEGLRRRIAVYVNRARGINQVVSRERKQAERDLHHQVSRYVELKEQYKQYIRNGYFDSLNSRERELHANSNRSVTKPAHSPYSAEEYQNLTLILKQRICSSLFFCETYPTIGNKSESEKRQAINGLQQKFSNLVLDEAERCNFSNESTAHYLGVVANLRQYQDQGDTFKRKFVGDAVNLSRKDASKPVDLNRFCRAIDGPLLASLCDLLDVIDIYL